MPRTKKRRRHSPEFKREAIWLDGVMSSDY
jgi:transposase-like protein